MLGNAHSPDSNQLYALDYDTASGWLRRGWKTRAERRRWLVRWQFWRLSARRQGLAFIVCSNRVPKNERFASHYVVFADILAFLVGGDWRGAPITAVLRETGPSRGLRSLVSTAAVKDVLRRHAGRVDHKRRAIVGIAVAAASVTEYD